MARPTRFGSVITASSVKSIHSPSIDPVAHLSPAPAPTGKRVFRKLDTGFADEYAPVIGREHFLRLTGIHLAGNALPPLPCISRANFPAGVFRCHPCVMLNDVD